MAFLECKDLTKIYGKKTVLDGFDMDLHPGECLGLFGPNGAGKSTLVNLICGIVKPDRGSVEFKGKAVADRDFRWDSSLGMVLEIQDLFEYLTIKEHLLFCASLHAMDEKEANMRCDELLEFTDLKDNSATLVGECSQGMRKKTAIASSIIHGPEVLLLDEAFNGLDTVSSSDFRELLNKRKNRSIIITSHSLSDMEKIVDRAIILDKGQKKDDSALNDILQKSSDLESHYLSLTGHSAAAGACEWF